MSVDPADEQAAAAAREAARAAGDALPIPPAVLGEVTAVAAAMVRAGASWLDLRAYLDARVRRFHAEQRELEQRLAALDPDGAGPAPS